jgi:hypothetical protein
MKQIVLHNSQVCLVSDEDYEKVSQYKWVLSRKYAVAKVDGKHVPLHHFILGKPDNGYVVDHINRNSLDNRRENLRFATRSQNAQNTTTHNKYQGITLTKGKDKWAVSCKHQYFGCFEKEEDAARHYDKVAFLLFGENAKTNGLISYNEVININIDDLRPVKHVRDLPINITYTEEEKYRVRVNYKNKQFLKKSIITLAEAIVIKDEFLAEVQKIKEVERLEHLSQDIVRNEDGLAIIKVKDKTIIIDDILWHDYVKKAWYINNGGYAAVSINKLGYLMHRLVMGITETNTDVIVDHINRNRLDNRRENLRIVDSLLNSHNSTKQANTSSRFHGISKCGDDKWDSKITSKGKKYYLGKFDDELFAADAYNRKAIELYGKDARLNVFTELELGYINNNESKHMYDIKTEAHIKNHNKPKKHGTASRYIGVHKMGKKWQARISHKNKRQHLGTYKTERAAAEAYNDAAIELYGAHANLNTFV